MTLRTLTNTDLPVAMMGTDASYRMRIVLVGPDGRARPVLTDSNTRWGHIEITDADLVDGVYSVALPVTDGTMPEAHYSIDQWMEWTDADGQRRKYYDRGIGSMPAGASALLWADFYTPGAEVGCSDWNAFIAHARDDAGLIPADRHLSTDERAAMSAASAPNGANPFATVADVTGGALPTGQADADLLAGQPLRLLANGHLTLAAATVAGHGEIAGLCGADTPSGNGAPYTRGQITRANWSAIAGSATLTPGAVYYLSPAAPGTVTSTPNDDNYLVRVGIATSTDTLQAAIQPPIKL